ncbi:hypothetical protein D5086_011795 [Populus alba]|uniref:Uncharacterized protein n=1 Tax=Populus alba TaxID=43335 RepID=A0ACC4CEB6_POPAL
MLFSSSPPPPLLRINSLYTAKPPFTAVAAAAAPREDLPLEAYPRSAGGSTASPKQRSQVKSGWKLWEQLKFSFSVKLVLHHFQGDTGGQMISKFIRQ